MRKKISTIEDLRDLKKFGNRRGIRDVEIELLGYITDIREQEARINKSLKACGCELGAVFAAAGLIAMAAAVLLVPSLDFWNASRIIFAILALFGLALTGKLLGLVIADRRMRTAINAIERDVLTVPKRSSS